MLWWRKSIAADGTWVVYNDGASVSRRLNSTLCNFDWLRLEVDATSISSLSLTDWGWVTLTLSLNYSRSQTQVFDSDRAVSSHWHTVTLWMWHTCIEFPDLLDWSDPLLLSKTPTTVKVKGLKRQNSIRGSLNTVNETEIALFRYGSKVYAINDRCPHAGTVKQDHLRK